MSENLIKVINTLMEELEYVIRESEDIDIRNRFLEDELKRKNKQLAEIQENCKQETETAE
jgi:hypothetical protein